MVVRVLSALASGGALLWRRGGDDVGRGTRRQHEDGVELRPGCSGDGAVDVAMPAIEEALARLVCPWHAVVPGVLVRKRSLDDLDEDRPGMGVPAGVLAWREAGVRDEDVGLAIDASYACCSDTGWRTVGAVSKSGMTT
jgi:hypothetical protein